MCGIARVLARIVTIAIVTAVCVSAAEPRQLELTGVARAKVVTSARLPYLAITPQAFSDRSQHFPLIVFLHGGDQSGNDLNFVKVNGPPKFALNHPDFPAVVVAPQLQPGRVWEPQAVIAVVKQAIKKYRIDPSRVYLTGLSTGGYGTWKTALEFPEYFAGVAPVAGGGSTEPIKHANSEKLQALRGLRLWAFHGGSDNIINPDESQRLVGELQRIGNSGARATIFPGAPHDIWNRVYDDPAFYNWLLQ